MISAHLTVLYFVLIAMNVLFLLLKDPDLKGEKEETVAEYSKINCGGISRLERRRPRFWKTPASWKSKGVVIECEHCGAGRKGSRENFCSSVIFIFIFQLFKVLQCHASLTTAQHKIWYLIFCVISIHHHFHLAHKLST